MSTENFEQIETAPKRRGRPKKSPEQKAHQYSVILERLREGCSRSAAMASIGKSRDLFSDWCRLDPDFARAAMEAEATAERAVTRALYDSAVGRTITEVTVVDKGAGEQIVTTKTYVQVSVPAQIAWLSRRRPAEWGEKHVAAAVSQSNEETSGVAAVVAQVGDPRILALHNDLLSKALKSAGVEMDEDLMPPGDDEAEQESKQAEIEGE